MQALDKEEQRAELCKSQQQHLLFHGLKLSISINAAAEI